MGVMPPNPYTPGELPRVLAGREPQQDRIRGYLARVATYGEMGGPLLVFLGPRGVGKTSLLRQAQGDAEAHGFLSAWIACRRNAPFLPDLVSRVDHAVQAADILPRAEAKRWRLRLERIGMEIGVPGIAKVTATATTGRPPRPAGRWPRISVLEDLLHETSIQIRARGGAGLVVVIDELHAPARDDTAVLLNVIQNLAGRARDNPLAMIAAGLPSTPAALIGAATFGERSTFITLPRLGPDAAKAAIAGPAAELHVGWTDAALAEVAGRAQGFPYLLQVIAHATWQAARPGENDVIDIPAVRAGLPIADEQLTTMYAARWTAATDLEQQFMAAMADAGTATVTRAAIAAALARPTQALGVPRERLIDKGIIEPAGHGELRFTMPGFDRYIRDATATAPAPPARPGQQPPAARHGR